jgi:hypothetical protein
VPVFKNNFRWRIAVSEQVLLSLWRQHASWAQTAMKLRARRAWWRTVVLVLIFGGAGLQTLAVALENTGARRWVGACGVFALLAVAVLSRKFLQPDEARKWQRSRCVSEGIKSEIYAYRAGAAPYVGEHALEQLRTKVGNIVDWAQDMAGEVDVGPMPQPVPPPLNEELYLQRRVARQIERYCEYATTSARRALLFHWIQIGLVVLTAGLGAAVTIFSAHEVMLGAWIAVLTTMVGGVAAYAAGSRYELRATTALAVVHELQDLVEGWRASGERAPSPEWSEFVRACEEVISADSRSWMAKIDQGRFP